MWLWPCYRNLCWVYRVLGKMYLTHLSGLMGSKADSHTGDLWLSLRRGDPPILILWTLCHNYIIKKIKLHDEPDVFYTYISVELIILECLIIIYIIFSTNYAHTRKIYIWCFLYENLVSWLLFQKLQLKIDIEFYSAVFFYL